MATNQKGIDYMNDYNTKTCTLCKRILPADLSHFYRQNGGKYGLAPRCKECKGGSFGIKKINTVRKAKEGYMFCGTCKKELPLNNNYFYKRKLAKSGWNSRCKKCHGHNYGIRHPNVVFEAKENNKFCSVCKKELPHKEFSKSAENKDGYKSCCKKCSSIQRKEYLSRPEVKKSKREYDKKWAKKFYSTKAGKAMNKKHIHIRKSRKVKAYYNYSPMTWKETLEEFEYSCAYCGKSDDNLQQEHIIPLSKQGPYTKQNIIPACSFCNGSKHNHNLNDWYPEQSFYSKDRHEKINKWAAIKGDIQQLSLL